MSLLTLPYAGRTPLVVLNTPSLIDTVKNLKRWSQSAGNGFKLNKSGTSETLRNEIVPIENLKPISEHVPVHTRPINDEQFAHYLAGLIDGNGNFTEELRIVFNIQNVSAAYFVKKYIGYGKVIKVNNNCIYFVGTKGLFKIINLINGKIRSSSKLDQVNNILKNTSRFELNTSNDLENHWLAGFSDSRASFEIELIDSSFDVLFNYQIIHADKDLLVLIKNYIGGNISFCKDTYYYKSSSYGSARKVIKYFNKYHMCSQEHVNYLKWRKVYLLVQNKDHTTSKIDKIIKLKNSINKLNKYNLR